MCVCVCVCVCGVYEYMFISARNDCYMCVRMGALVSTQCRLGLSQGHKQGCVKLTVDNSPTDKTISLTHNKSCQ